MHLSHGFGVLAVDVEDRNAQHLRQPRRIDAGTVLFGRCGKPDLVVDDHVDRAADRIGLELAEVQRFLNDALARKGGVAVHQDDQAALTLVVVVPVLLGPHAPQGNGIHELEVAGVEAQRDVYVTAVDGLPVGAEPEVVLHVAAAAVQMGVDIRELTENLLRALAHDVREHVEPAAMRHAQHDLFHAVGRRLLDRQDEQRDQALGPLERKTLRADELLLDELFENHRVRQAGEDADLLIAAQGAPVLADLHALLQPLAHLLIVDVHELHADRTAVGVPQAAEHRADRGGGAAGQRLRRHRTAEVVRAQAVIGGIEFRRLRPRQVQRVDGRDHVAAHAVRPDHLVNAILRSDGLLIAGRRRQRRAVGSRAKQPGRMEAGAGRPSVGR